MPAQAPGGAGPNDGKEPLPLLSLESFNPELALHYDTMHTTAGVMCGMMDLISNATRADKDSVLE